MKNKKLLYVLIPVIIIVLALIVGGIFLASSGSPEKIFKTAIGSAFEMFESSEEQFSTMKGTMNLAASVESDNEQMQAINTMLEGTSIGLDMQADTANMIINENLNVILNNESLLNATVLLQDQKGYVYLKDYLDKYLEVPQEDMEYSDLTEYYDKIATLDQDALMEAIKEELIESISAQELVQEDTTLVLDGQETKVTASTLNLQGQANIMFAKGFLTNLKANEKFQTALGDFKDDAMTLIDDMLANQNPTAEDMNFVFTIYTKGFLNEFVGVSGKAIDTYYEEIIGLDVLKHNDGKYEFTAYNEYDGEREENFNITVEDKKESKNKGIATITMTVEEEQFIVTYSYEKQGKQTSFVISTEIEGVALSISGNVVEDGKNIKGDFTISVQEETFGKINVNCAYDFTYDVEVQKVDVGNAVLIDEMSEEDKEEFWTNFENSDAYEILQPIAKSITEMMILDAAIDATENVANSFPEITYDGYTVRYAVPENFELSEYSSEDYKMYMDDNFNSINIGINETPADTYMNDLEDEYVLTSEFYENQKISDTRSYIVNGKEYKFRTLTYNDEYGTYVNLYFAYGLDEEYCYAVEVESEGGNISMDTIKYFLDVIIE